MIIYFVLIKLGELYDASEREPVPSRNKIRALVFFFIMINDLIVKNARLWKYVDDTTISETVAKGELITSNAQRTNVLIKQYAQRTDKKQSPEMRISFTKSQQNLSPFSSTAML